MSIKNTTPVRKLKTEDNYRLNGLEPIPSMNMTDQVEERLLKFFAQKGYKAGQAIPKEQELASSLQVSRNILREAISRLRMLGIIESRKRRGMVLAEPDIMSGLERILDSKMLLSKTVLKQLFELRLTIEIGMSDLLFMRKTEEGLCMLEKIVAEEKVKAVTDKDHVKYEIAFHGTLYHMTGNDTLYKFQKMLVHLFDYALEEMEQLEEKKRHGAIEHADLIRILRKGDADKFRIAMRKHLDPYFLLLTLK